MIIPLGDTAENFHQSCHVLDTLGRHVYVENNAVLLPPRDAIAVGIHDSMFGESRAHRFQQIGEVHLHSYFGLTFRREFLSLKTSLFDLLFDLIRIGDGHTNKIPVLLVTATCSKAMVSDFEHMSGLTIDPHNFLWPHSSLMQHRSVNILVKYSERPFTLFQQQVLPTLIANPTSKAIVYSNRRTKVERFKAKITGWLDRKSSHSHHTLDVVLLVGASMTKEQKFFNVNLFVNGTPSFKPRILAATSGAANAGIDCPNVNRVMYQLYQFVYWPISHISVGFVGSAVQLTRSIDSY